MNDHPCQPTEFQKLDVSDLDLGGNYLIRYKYSPVENADDNGEPYLPLSLSFAERHSTLVGDPNALIYGLRRHRWDNAPENLADPPTLHDCEWLLQAAKARLRDDIEAFPEGNLGPIWV